MAVLHYMIEMLKKHFYMLIFLLTFSIKTQISFIIIVSFASSVWMCKIKPFKLKLGIVTGIVQEVAFTIVTLHIPFVYHKVSTTEVSDSLVYSMAGSSALSVIYIIYLVVFTIRSWVRQSKNSRVQHYAHGEVPNQSNRA